MQGIPLPAGLDLDAMTRDDLEAFMADQLARLKPAAAANRADAVVAATCRRAYPYWTRSE